MLPYRKLHDYGQDKSLILFSQPLDQEPENVGIS